MRLCDEVEGSSDVVEAWELNDRVRRGPTQGFESPFLTAARRKQRLLPLLSQLTITDLLCDVSSESAVHRLVDPGPSAQPGFALPLFSSIVLHLDSGMTAADFPIPEAAGVRVSPLIPPPGKPLVRTRSASSTMSREAYLNSGLSGASPYDLPEGDAMAELQPSTSRSSLPSSNSKAGFKGGPPLKASETRRTKRARQQDAEHIKEEDEEDLKLEAELSEEERRADLMYARFSEKRKSIIVAIVAVAALLARECISFIPFAKGPPLLRSIAEADLGARARRQPSALPRS